MANSLIQDETSKPSKSAKTNSKQETIVKMKSQEEELKQREKSKDFFCVVSDAFRVGARRTSAVWGSAWAFAVALLIILTWTATGPAFHGQLNRQAMQQNLISKHDLELDAKPEDVSKVKLARLTPI
jgi:low affinity iron permease